MPELPEVETTVRGLEKVLLGQRIARVELRRGDLRRAFPDDLGQRLTGAAVTSLGRRAKYGLIATDRGDTMIFHLGMSGRWRIDPVELGAHDHLLIETGDGRVVALNDPRRFGSVDLEPSETLFDWPPFKALGPEPLGGALSGGWLKHRLAGRKAAIKLMLDQRIVAGWHIYVCEACTGRGSTEESRRAGQPPTLDALRRRSRRFGGSDRRGRIVIARFRRARRDWAISRSSSMSTGARASRAVAARAW